MSSKYNSERQGHLIVSEYQVHLSSLNISFYLEHVKCHELAPLGGVDVCPLGDFHEQSSARGLVTIKRRRHFKECPCL